MKLAVRCLLHNIAFYSFFRNTLLVWLANPLVYRNGLPSDTGMCAAGGYYNSFFPISGSAIFTITAPAPYISDKHLKIKVSYNNPVGKFHGFEMAWLDLNGNRVDSFKK